MYYRFNTIKYHKILGYRILPFIMTSLKIVPMNPLMFFMMLTSKNCKLYVPKGCEEAYRASDLWKDFNIIEMEIGIRK